MARLVYRNRLTRLGWHFAFVAGFAMLGGSIRGFNLLLILAGLMVAALIIQWRWSKRMIESLGFGRRLPSEAFAGTPFRVRFSLTNHHRFLPAWMLRFDDKICRANVPSSVDPVTWTARTGVGVIAPRQTLPPHYVCRITRRGTYQFGTAAVSTRFPLSLMKSQVVSLEIQELDVYPRLLTLRRGWQTTLLNRSGGASVNANQSGTDDGEFFGLREYQPGDNPKWIHWRTSARLPELAVRQFEQQRRYDVCILLDAYMPDETSSTGDQALDLSDEVSAAGYGEMPVEEYQAEKAVSLAATMLLDLSSAPGNRIVLASAGKSNDAVMGGAAFESRKRMFQMLARTEFSQQPDLQSALVKAIQAVGSAQDLIVVSSRSRKEAIENHAEIKNTLRGWSRRGNVRWLDVRSPNVQRMIGQESSDHGSAPGFSNGSTEASDDSDPVSAGIQA